MNSSGLGFIGAGQMATALASGIVRAGKLAGNAISAYDPSPSAASSFSHAVVGCHIAASPQELLCRSSAVVLAVKPQHALEACQPLAGQLEHRLVISVIAGIRLQQLRQWLGTDRLVRVMPNTPCLVGCGATGFATSAAVTAEEIAWVQQLLSSVGYAVAVPESLLDAVTGLSGSGPAYVALFLEALADGGVRAGLPRSIAWQLALHTVRGTAELLLQSHQHPGDLKDQVASPGGTTIAGLSVLERRAVRGAVIDAVSAAADRAQELAHTSHQ